MSLLPFNFMCFAFEKIEMWVNAACSQQLMDLCTVLLLLVLFNGAFKASPLETPWSVGGSWFEEGKQ